MVQVLLALVVAIACLCSFMLGAWTTYRSMLKENIVPKLPDRSDIPGPISPYELDKQQQKYEFEIDIFKLPNVVLFPDMCTRFVIITSVRNFVIL